MIPAADWPFAPFPARKPHLILGHGLSLLGWSLAFLFFAALPALSIPMDSPPEWLYGPSVPAIRRWLYYGLWLAVLAAGPFSVRLIEIGRRLRVRDAISLLEKDQRKPVVLLRSFADETIYDPSMNFGLHFVRTRYEENLCNALRQLGPVIAIGNPSEKLPQTGAARLYVRDSEWKKAVDFFLHYADAVLVIIGRSPGVWWEIEYVLNHVQSQRILYFFPYVEGKKVRESILRAFWLLARSRSFTRRRLKEMKEEREQRYELFRRRLSELLPQVPLPESLGDTYFIDFDPTGGLRMLPTKSSVLLPVGRSGREMKMVSVNMKKSLRPFIEKVKLLQSKGNGLLPE